MRQGLRAKLPTVSAAAGIPSVHGHRPSVGPWKFHPPRASEEENNWQFMLPGRAEYDCFSECFFRLDPFLLRLA